MSKFKLCWWENNGYHDSYFYGVYFDDVDGKLHSTELGATAYAGGIGFTDEYQLPTLEILEKARLELAKIIFTTLRAAEDRDVLAPCVNNVVAGREFRLLEPHSVYKRTVGKAYVRDENGKRVKVTFPAGHVFKSRGAAAFYGTTYRNGYNQPSRFNSSLSTSYRDELGAIWFINVPLEKLRQNCEPMSDADLRKRADELSHNMQFGSAFGCRAWTTDNWAAAIWEGRKEVAV